jgi:hypothetical protein
MRVFWRLVGLVGLLTAVVAGTWACLSTGAGTDRGAWAVLAATGVVLVGLSVQARGMWRQVARDVRIRGGALGLVVFAPVAVLALMAAGTGSDAAGPFGLATVAAFSLWVQGVAAALPLPVRLASAWVGLAVVVAVLLLVGLVLFMALWRSVGLDSLLGTRSGGLTFVALVGAGVAVWGRSRSDRRSVPGVLARVAVGRAVPSDRQLLLAGPAALLRKLPW